MIDADDRRRLANQEALFAEYKEENRKNLRFAKSCIPKLDDMILGTIPERKLGDRPYKDRWLRWIGYCLYIETHGHLSAEHKKEFPEAKTPPEGIRHRNISRHNGGIGENLGYCTGTFGPWTTSRHTAKLQHVNAGLWNVVSFVGEKPQHQPQWNHPWHDIRNDHPDAVAWREERAKQTKEMKEAIDKRRKADQEAERRKVKRLEKEAKERRKLKKEQRKERKKHFAEQEKKRSGKA